MGIDSKFKTIEVILNALCACGECGRLLVVFDSKYRYGVQSDQTALWIRFDWISDKQWVGYHLVFRHGYTTR